MTTQSPVEFFKRQTEVILIERDFDAFSKLFAPDSTFRDMTELEPRRGIDEVLEHMAGFLEMFAEIEVEHLSLFGEGEFVAAESIVRALYRGEGAGPGGTRVALQFCTIDQIRDGLVQRETVYWDPQELVRQLPAATQTVGAV